MTIDTRTCVGTTRAGARCTRRPLADSDRCDRHDSRAAAARGRRGGVATGETRRMVDELPVKLKLRTLDRIVDQFQCLCHCSLR